MEESKTSRYCSVYGVYNTINGKVYIGVAYSCKERWREHRRTKHKYAIHYALQKYGLNNFIFKQIEEFPDRKTALQKENEWILLLKELGYSVYNQTEGGEKGTGYVWSAEQKDKASIRLSGVGNPMYGVQLFGKDNPNFGKEMKSYVKEELLKHRRKLSDVQIEQIKTMFLTGTYTQTNLAQQFKMSLTQIHSIIKGKSWGGEKKSDLIKNKNMTMEDAVKIREMYKSKEYTMTQLGKIFNRSAGHISKIIAGEKWAVKADSLQQK